MLDPVAWADAEELVRGLIGHIVAPYGVVADVDYIRGVPPVVNEPRSTAILADAVEATLGEPGIVSTTQSLGGEDFGWYLEQVPGAMGRLGTRTPGGRRSTCTRATCASTSAPWASAPACWPRPPSARCRARPAAPLTRA